MECRQAANSRAGAPIRAALTRERVRRGLWENPAEYHTPETLHASAVAVGQQRAATFRAEVTAGTWANPADAPGARDKLSRPRAHAGDPALHRAIERLTAGAAVADLGPAEAEAHRRYRRSLGAALRRQPPNPALRQAWQRAGLSQAELARRLGVVVNTVWSWEAYGATPTPAHPQRVADLLGCDSWEVSA